MAAVAPRNMAEFMDVHGVGGVKAEQYGKTFLEAIERYAVEHGLRPKAGARETERDSARPRARGATYEETKRLLSEGLTVAEIAERRGLSAGSVIGHVERMAGQAEALDVAHVAPAGERLREIEKAFHVCGSAYLRPVWEFLGDGFTYEELRLARVHLRQEGRLPPE